MRHIIASVLAVFFFLLEEKYPSNLRLHLKTCSVYFRLPGWTKAESACLESWQRFWQAFTCGRLTICSELLREAHAPTS